MPTEEIWLTRREVADLRGCSTDTVRRDLKRDSYPNARTRPDTTWEIPLRDLVAAGHHDPATTEAPKDSIDRVRSDREAGRLRQELARAESRIESLEQQLADVKREAREDKRFFQQFLLQGRVA